MLSRFPSSPGPALNPSSLRRLRRLALSSRPAVLLVGLLAVLAGCSGETFESQGEWPEFRGPDGQGRAAEGTSLPSAWGPDSENIRWRVPVEGVGNSSPIVVDGQVLVTVADPTPEELKKKGNAPSKDLGETGPAGPDLRRSVVSYDLQTGEPRWRTDVFSAPPEKGHFLSTNAAPTPLTNGEHVWVYYGQYLAKLTLDGELVWNREVDAKYPSHVRYGASSSPIFAGGLVILYQDREWVDTPDVGWAAGFDPDTGKEVWRIEWSDSCCAYTTPTLWQRGNVEDLVFGQSAAVVAYDPRSGEERWRLKHGQLQTVASLTVVDDEVICSLSGAHSNKGNLCLRVTGSGDAVQVEQLWENLRRAPESASSIYYRGKIYAVTESGIVSCYEAISGEQLWVGRLKEGRGYRSSLVAGDGKIYAQSTFFVTAVIDAAADDRLEVISYSETPEGGNNATPAIADGCLVLRTSDHLYCIDPETESEATQPQSE